MIIGIGLDNVDIPRIERSLERFGDRFTHRLFTPVERAKADRRARRAETYAKRFAAKEACSKALGTGFAQGVFWRDIGVENLPSGKPVIVFTGGALRQLEAITPPGTTARVEVTLTDDYPRAQALVIISATPRS